jgi:NADH-quinone oxidoreductase subunit N
MVNMASINANLMIALPEIFLAGMILLILVADAFIKVETSTIAQAKEIIIFALTGAALLIACYLQVIVCNLYSSESVVLTFNNMFILDGLAVVMKIASYVVGFVILLYVRQYIKDRGILCGEFYVIFLFAILVIQV